MEERLFRYLFTYVIIYFQQKGLLKDTHTEIEEVKGRRSLFRESRTAKVLKGQNSLTKIFLWLSRVMEFC